MFDQLLNLVKENAGDAIINNPAIPNEKNDEAISLATNGILSGLQSQLASGNISDVIQLLGGKSDVNNHPVTNAVSQNVAGDLMNKFGLSGNAASSIVTSLVPIVMNKLIHKTNDPNDSSFDLNGVFSHLSGGKTQGMDMGNILGSLTGGNSSVGGLGNVLGSVMGVSNSGGGLGDLMKIFKG